ncbi:MAG: lycopene cyclase domain-containing protein [Syntrophothermus sp.]
MNTYLLINLLIIIFPLAMSFEGRVRYYKKYKFIFSSIAAAAVPYLLWDSIAAYRGDWSFNDKYVMDFRLMHLPAEEILFFITVPYSALFVYESLCIYLKDTELKINKMFFTSAGLILSVSGILFFPRYYTFTVFIFAGIFLILNAVFNIKLLRSSIYWIFILLMYVPFMIFNYILTSLPVVEYSSNAILGYRFLTIPAEDFLYSFSMLSLNLSVYLLIKKKWQKKIEK